MHKKIAAVLAVCIAVCFTLTGCGYEPYADYDLSDYLKAGTYDGLTVKPYSTTVTDSEVNEEIQSRLEDAAEEKQVKTGTVKKGDKINIDYTGRINGKEFDGGSATDVDITLGSSGYIDGFDEGLYGKKVGSTTDLDLTFPDDYQSSKLAGKAVVFTVTINYKTVSVVPELDAAFVKEHSDETTVAGYKAYVKKELVKQKKEDGIQDQKDQLWTKAQAAFTLKKDKDGNYKYPEKEVERVESYITQKYENYADQYNMTFNKFLDSKLGMTEKEFKKNVKTVAQSQVRQEMICYYIAQKENITVSNKEYKEYISNALDKLGYTEKTFKQTYGSSYEEYNGEDNIWYACYLDKVEDYLLDNAKVVSN
ncbi:MAG: trigger factor [Anaerovoracaceae bacterium]|jgi:trigger factor